MELTNKPYCVLCMESE